MKNVLLIFALGILLYSCGKDDDGGIQPENYDYYLQKTKPQFRAALGSASLNWVFDVCTYQMSQGMHYPYEDSYGSLEFGLLEEDGDSKGEQKSEPPKPPKKKRGRPRKKKD